MAMSTLLNRQPKIFYGQSAAVVGACSSKKSGHFFIRQIYTKYLEKQSLLSDKKSSCLESASYSLDYALSGLEGQLLLRP
jgi:hypothetical protein